MPAGPVPPRTRILDSSISIGTEWKAGAEKFLKTSGSRHIYICASADQRLCGLADFLRPFECSINRDCTMIATAEFQPQDEHELKKSLDWEILTISQHLIPTAIQHLIFYWPSELKAPCFSPSSTLLVWITTGGTEPWNHQKSWVHSLEIGATCVA